MHLYAFDTDPQTIEGPVVHVTKTSRGERVGVDVETAGRDHI